MYNVQDYNFMWCILMAPRVIYFPVVIYGDPVHKLNNFIKFHKIMNLVNKYIIYYSPIISIIIC